MDPLTLFGLVAVSLMLIFYALEDRGAWAILSFAVASVAPALGPMIGGYITDALDWYWLFYINLIPGTLVAIMVAIMVQIDEPDLSLLRCADYPGMVLMAACLGTLEYGHVGRPD